MKSRRQTIDGASRRFGPIKENVPRQGGGGGKSSRAPPSSRRFSTNPRLSMGAKPKRSLGGSRPSLGGSRPSLGGSRTSLGGSRPSFGGSRASLGGNRFSIGGDTKSASQSRSNRRATFGGRPAGRRTPGKSHKTPSKGRRTPMRNRRASLYQSSMGHMKDPRPIGKIGSPYFNQCVEVVMNFLTKFEYPNRYDRKIIQSPSTKDFRMMMEFAIRQIDPEFAFDDFAKEVKHYLTTLGYPFAHTISKSSLSSAGAPHTWPALLAAFVWVTEAINFKDSREELKEQNGASQGEIYYHFLTDAYAQFLEGDDNYTMLEDDVRERLLEHEGALDDDLKKEESRNEELKREIERLCDSQNDVNGLRSKRQDFLADSQKFQKLIATVLDHKQALQKKLKERQSEAEKSEQKIKELTAEEAELQRLINSQELSQVEVTRINNETKMKRAAIRDLDAECEEQQKEVWELEMELCKKVETIERTVREYRHGAAQHQLVPVEAKYAGGIKYDIEFVHKASSVQEMLSCDLKKVELGLRGIIDRAKSVLHNDKAQMKMLNAERNSLTDQAQESEDNRQMLQERLDKIQGSYREEKKAFHREMNDLVLRIEDQNMENQKMRDEMKQHDELSERKVETISRQLANQRAALEQDWEARKSEMIDTIRKLVNFKDEKCISLLREFRSSISRQKKGFIADTAGTLEDLQANVYMSEDTESFF